MKKNRQRELFDKIQAGVDLYYQRLVEEKRRTGGTLVVWRDGRVVQSSLEHIIHPIKTRFIMKKAIFPLHHALNMDLRLNPYASKY